MIRVRTFLKYARIHLEEADAALRRDRLAMVTARCRDMAIALTKAMAASLPGIKKDFLEMDEKDLSRAISDLAETPDEACRIAKSICELRRARDLDAGSCSKAKAEEVFFRAEEIYRSVHNLCLGPV